MPLESAHVLWLELRITTIPALVEPLSALLWELAPAAVEEQPLEQGGVRLIANLRLDGVTTEACASQALQHHAGHLTAAIQAVEGFFTDLPAPQLECCLLRVPDQDWQELWRRQLELVRISERLLITPPWLLPEARRGEVVVQIDPGDAFGSGLHETTRACLHLLDALFGQPDMLEVRPFRGPVEVLDVGTGTGVLLLSALLLGARGGLGIDLDPAAIRSAQANASLNNLAARTRFELQTLRDVDGIYKLVMANLLLPTLIELAPLLTARVHQHGALVVSGLTADQEAEAVACFSDAGMRLEARCLEGPWLALLFRSERGVPPRDNTRPRATASGNSR